MNHQELTAAIRLSIEVARASEPSSIDARARSFIATLAGSLVVADKAMAAEIYSVLINLPAVGAQ